MVTAASLITICLFLAVSASAHCPEECRCTRTVTRCIFKNLTTVPSKLPPHTTVLDLRFNRLTSLSPHCFGRLRYLHTLLLNDNQIRQIDDDAFEGLSHLRHLFFYNNELTAVGDRTFRGLHNLQVLNLHLNHLIRLTTNSLHPLPNLQKLYLNNNRLTGVSVTTVRQLKKLELLRIESNPLHCDCKLQLLADYLKRSRNIRTYEETVCLTPPELTGDKVLSIKLECPVQEQTTARDINLGSEIRLLCRVDTSDEGVEIEWLHNDAHISPESHPVKYHLTRGGELLTVTNTTTDDEGYYECVVTRRTDGMPVKMKKTLLRHRRQLPSPQGVSSRLHAPVFTVRPRHVKEREGSRVRLHCEAVGSPLPRIIWYKGGRLIESNQRYQLNDAGTILTVTPLMRDTVGEYTCEAVNEFGHVRTTAQMRMTLSSPPRIGQPPTAQTVAVYGRARFTCVAQGHPTPHYVWHFNGSPIPTTRGHYSISVNGTELVISRVTERDAGWYMCQAANAVGSSTAQVQLKVVEHQSTHGGRQQPVDQSVTQELIQERVRQATQNVDRAINKTRLALYDGKAKSPSEILALFRFPGPQAIELARAREIYEQTLKLIQVDVERGIMVNSSRDPSISQESLLSVSHLQTIMELSGCTPRQFKDPCSDMCFHLKYRSYDGQCNNLQQPMWGVSLMPFQRLMSPIYENGFNTPVGWNADKLYNGHRKPNARSVSIRIVSSSRTTDDEQYSAMLMQWGQFVDHDMDFTAAAASRHIFSGGSICNRTCENSAPCFNIPMPLEDPRRASQREELQPCIEFERSSATCGSGETSVIFRTVTYREQLNIITSFIDGSQIYGSSEQGALDLRDLFSDHGQLRFDIVSHAQKPYLPFNRDAPMDCQRNSTHNHPIRCFMAGDFRANEQLGLLSMHTVWLREHNRIAAQLLKINPHWDGERIYHETRKIVGAQLQHITYRHWLPKILGTEWTEKLGDYQRYRPDVNPSVTNVFATAAFRFGHALINPFLYRFDKDFNTIPQGHLPLHLAFFAPERLLSEGGVDPILRGLFASPGKQVRSDQMLNKELTERLFSRAHDVALDLAALNIQRGRDHALPGYLEWRGHCNLSTPQSWEQLGEAIPDVHVRNKLRRLYGHPANLDLWVGGLAERPLVGGRVGPTFACIIADQFRRARDGDRFWYENPSTFTQLQLEEIRRTSLATVLCKNGDSIDRVPADVFAYDSNRENYQRCEHFPSINLNLWQVCCQDNTCSDRHNGQFGSGSSGSNEIVETLPNVRAPNTPEYRKPKTRLQNLRQRQHDQPAEASTDRLQDRLKEMERTVEDLQRRLASISAQTTKNEVCTDARGVSRADGERWLIDRCTRCNCSRGQIWCTEQTCPKLNCRRRIRLPSQCCPICERRA